MPSMVEDERAVHNIPLNRRIALLVLYSISGIWGSAMKFFLFYYLKREKISERPINALIFIDQFVDYIGNIVVIINTIIKVTHLMLLFLKIISNLWTALVASFQHTREY